MPILTVRTHGKPSPTGIPRINWRSPFAQHLKFFFYVGANGEVYELTRQRRMDIPMGGTPQTETAGHYGGAPVVVRSQNTRSLFHNALQYNETSSRYSVISSDMAASGYDFTFGKNWTTGLMAGWYQGAPNTSGRTILSNGTNSGEFMIYDHNEGTWGSVRLFVRNESAGNTYSATLTVTEGNDFIRIDRQETSGATTGLARHSLDGSTDTNFDEADREDFASPNTKAISWGVSTTSGWTGHVNIYGQAFWQEAFSSAKSKALFTNYHNLFLPGKSATVYSFGSTWTAPQKLNVSRRYSKPKTIPTRPLTIDDIEPYWAEGLEWGMKPSWTGLINNTGSGAVNRQVVREFVRGYRQSGGVSSGATQPYIHTEKGIAIQGVSTGNTRPAMDVEQDVRFAGATSSAWLGFGRAVPTGTQVHCAFKLNGPQNQYHVELSTGKEIQSRIDTTGGQPWSVLSNPLWPDNKWVAFGASWLDDTNNVWLSGQKGSDANTTGTLEVNSGNAINWGADNGAAYWPGELCLALLWINRGMTDSEMIYLTLNDGVYDLFKPQKAITYSFPSNKPATPTPHIVLSL